MLEEEEEETRPGKCDGPSGRGTVSESVIGLPEGITNWVLPESEEILIDSSLVTSIDCLSLGSEFFKIPIVLSTHRPNNHFDSFTMIWDSSHNIIEAMESVSGNIGFWVTVLLQPQGICLHRACHNYIR